tara:strand:- start:2473 stop:2787 length:315 start_codon:yes stop_codon:yes gene_type:complete
MTFNEYQKETKKTAIYPPQYKFSYLLLGLSSEVGEVADKFKKHIRDGGDLDKKEIEKELGDVLWYLARLSDELELPLNQVAETNLDKLRSRLERDKIKGSGDNR